MAPGFVDGTEIIWGITELLACDMEVIKSAGLVYSWLIVAVTVEEFIENWGAIEFTVFGSWNIFNPLQLDDWCAFTDIFVCDPAFCDIFASWNVKEDEIGVCRELIGDEVENFGVDNDVGADEFSIDIHSPPENQHNEVLKALYFWIYKYN